MSEIVLCSPVGPRTVRRVRLSSSLGIVNDRNDAIGVRVGIRDTGGVDWLWSLDGGEVAPGGSLDITGPEDVDEAIENGQSLVAEIDTGAYGRVLPGTSLQVTLRRAVGVLDEGQSLLDALAAAGVLDETVVAAIPATGFVGESWPGAETVVTGAAERSGLATVTVPCRDGETLNVELTAHVEFLGNGGASQLNFAINDGAGDWNGMAANATATVRGNLSTGHTARIRATTTFRINYAASGATDALIQHQTLTAHATPA